MTGQNEYVLSVFAKLMRINKENLTLVLIQCSEVLNKYDIRHLTNIGIPILYLNLKTKQQVLDYILNEVKECISTIQNHDFRKSQKEFRRLGRSVDKLITKIGLVFN